MTTLYFFVLLAVVTTQEVPTPSNLLKPRDFNHHPYAARQYLEELEPKPTKQGPVLFPNDTPPPPKTPLIVTSRPLAESIARSELNNTLASPSNVNNVFKPGYLARVSEYKPYDLNVPRSYDEVPYADVVKKFNYGDHRYDDYGEKTVLPPIYKALSDYANHKVFKTDHKNESPRYQIHDSESPDYGTRYQTNDVEDVDHNSDNNQAQNYAFSYTVKDHQTGDDYSHRQHSSGSGTNGEYRVRLPDGRMQIVSYTADENGYQANVRYDEGDEHSGNDINSNFNNKQTNNYKSDISNKKVYFDNTNKNYFHNHANQDIAAYKPLQNEYTDLSKDYYNDDYSSLEYDGKDDKYDPYKSKFNSFYDNNQKPDLGVTVAPRPINSFVSSTVKPSYDELKYLFVTKKPFYKSNQATADYLNAQIPVELKVPSTTPSPNYGETTEHVVVIGTKPSLYTNIRSSLAPITGNNYYVSTTPSSILYSSASNFGKSIDLSGPKPVLSNNYINRINKYLSLT